MKKAAKKKVIRSAKKKAVSNDDILRQMALLYGMMDSRASALEDECRKLAQLGMDRTSGSFASLCDAQTRDRKEIVRTIAACADASKQAIGTLRDDGQAVLASVNTLLRLELAKRERKPWWKRAWHYLTKTA